MKSDLGLVTVLAARLWAQRGQLVNWEHLGADVRGYEKTVAALSQLLELGFDVRLSPAGVRLVPPADTPCEADLLPEQAGPCVYSPVVDSTNTAGVQLARVGAHHGTTVIAEAQLKGRGHHGHEWFSPAGMGLWFSLILRPAASVKQPGLVPLLVGLCVVRVLRELGARAARLKWANDVLWGKRKVAGILVERVESGPREAFVAGVGINIHQKESDFPEEIRDGCLSLDEILGTSINRSDLLHKLVEELISRWHDEVSSGFGGVVKSWNEESGTVGMSVRAAVGQEILTGVIEGVGDAGELMLRCPDGSLRTMASGRIELMAKPDHVGL